jgi:uncharacterized protein (PEP-CTERM system associated)
LNAAAQTWRLEPSAKALVTATSNSGFADSADAGGDVIIELIPRVALTGRGARFKFDGTIDADSVSYVRNTVPNQFIPKANVATNVNAVERWVYLDASAQFEQATANPFSAASTATLPSARRQATQYRLSPYLDHAFSPTVSLLYRNDNVWTRVASDLSAAATHTTTERHGHSLVFTQRPVPLGYALEASQEQTDYSGSVDSKVELASARAILTYAIDPTLILGGVAGAERNQIAASTSTDTIRGLRLHWRPTERSDLDASVERRFFGNGWAATWSHRSPFMAMNANLTKQPASQPSTIFLPSTGGDLRTLINDAYTTRFPNPVERAAVVDTAIANLGSSATTAGPIAVFSDYAQLQRRASASVGFLSPLSALTFQWFAVKSVQLQRPDAPPLPLPPINADNTQFGGSVTFNRRLTSTLAIEAALSGVKIEGLGSSVGQSSSTKSARLSATQALSPKTGIVAGVRRQITNSTVVLPVNETAGFAGIEHKF